MKLKMLSVMAGVSAPLILSSSASAGFVGLKVVTKSSINANRLICNIYAEFDNPGPFQDHMNFVSAPIQIDVISGKFFNPGFANGDLAPSPQQILDNPNAAEDSFVTIGVKVFNSNDPGNGGQPPNDTGFVPGLPGWPGFGANKLSTTSSGWFVTPFAPQGDPFNPAYVGGNGQVLLAQLTLNDVDGDGFVAISGSMSVKVTSNGETIVPPVSFFHGLLPCPWDCQDIPNGFVDIPDVFELFSDWSTPTRCDFDGGGVGINDLFEMFGNWGECP